MSSETMPRGLLNSWEKKSGPLKKYYDKVSFYNKQLKSKIHEGDFKIGEKIYPKKNWIHVQFHA